MSHSIKSAPKAQQTKVDFDKADAWLVVDL
jgi:hypothetical protein